MNTATWFFLFAFIATFISVKIAERYDPSREFVENFIDSSLEIEEKIGSVRKKNLLRATLAASADDRDPYQIYIYLVDGTIGKIEIIIRVEGDEIRTAYIEEIKTR